MSRIEQEMPDLLSVGTVLVHQKMELAEFIGFETRNKYEFLKVDGTPFLYAAEQGKGLFGLLLRMLLGHWRSFDIYFFNTQRELVLKLKNPFRFFFRRIEVYGRGDELYGSINLNFSLLNKKFTIKDKQERKKLSVTSPLWRPWSFSFQSRGFEQAIVQKKWSGVLTEFLTDKDKFEIVFKSNDLNQRDRALILAAGLFIDLQYFEHKANS